MRYVRAQTRMANAVVKSGLPKRGGIESIRALRKSDLSGVPETPGVYMVGRPYNVSMRLLKRSPAGHFKGRDPSLPVSELRQRLRANDITLYIGKASGRSARSTLRARLRRYLRHGEGHRAAHWGGRAIWQIASSASLWVAWFPTSSRGARQLERELLADFKKLFAAYPFANRTG
jgi:hypothetical protein